MLREVILDPQFCHTSSSLHSQTPPASTDLTLMRSSLHAKNPSQKTITVSKGHSHCAAMPVHKGHHPMRPHLHTRQMSYETLPVHTQALSHKVVLIQQPLSTEIISAHKGPFHINPSLHFMKDQAYTQSNCHYKLYLNLYTLAFLAVPLNTRVSS